MLKIHLILFVTFIRLIVGSTEITIEGQFQECYVDESNSKLKIEKCPNSLTDDSKSRENYMKNDIRHEAMVFSKHTNYLEGEGFECFKRQHNYMLITTCWTGSHETKYEFTDIKLTRLECLSMINDNMCNGQPMNCSNRENCLYKEPRPVYMRHPGWCHKTPFTLYECSFRKKLLLSNSHNKNVLPNAIGSCKINDKKCELPDSIVVWQDEIIRTCLFERLLILNDLNDFKDKTTNETVFYYSNNQSMLFYLNKNKSTEIDCNGNIFIPTTEGFFLSFFTNDTEREKKLLSLAQSKLNMIHVQEKDLQSIILSQDDYAIFSVIQKNIIFACSAFINIIRSNLNHEDSFVPIDLGGDKEVVFYFRNGASYLPICRRFNNITVLVNQESNNNVCFEDIRILYKSAKSLKYKSGFLRKNGIVSHFSKRIDCKSTLNDRSVVFEDYLITRKTNMQVEVVKIEHEHATQFTQTFWNMKDIKKLFSHHEFLSERVGLLDNEQELVNSQQKRFLFNSDDIYQHLVTEVKKQGDSFLASIGKKISNLMNTFSNNITETVFLIIGIIILILILLLAIKIITLIKKCFCKF